MLPLSQSATEIPRPIIRMRHCCHCFYLTSNVLGRTLLCRELFCGRWIWSHQIRRCRSSEWDTVNVLPPNMNDIFLWCLYYIHPRCPAYLLMSLSLTASIIPNLFCCPCRLFLSFILYPLFVNFSNIVAN